MATPQLSPGIITREVDLTVGRVDNVLDNVGAIAGPFAIGPVEQATTINTEQELINTFGKPISTDAQYEYWMSASSYLSYGGILKVVRTDGTTLNNSNAGVSATSVTAKIKNYDNYNSTWSADSVGFVYAAKNPGAWSNNLKVCVIDDLADQIIGISTTNPSALGIQIGYGVTTALSDVTIPGVGSTSLFNGYLKGIITGVSTDATNSNSTISVKVLSRVSSASTQYNTTLITSASATAGIGATGVFVDSVFGLNVLDTLSAGGNNNVIISSIGSTSVSLASTITSSITSGTGVTFSRLVTIGGTETAINYAQSTSYASFLSTTGIRFVNNSGITTGSSATTVITPATAVDWYDQQTLGISNSTIYWKSIAPKPISNSYSLDRNGKNDALHVVLVDDTGSITGVRGNILEKHVSLSKATDTVSAVNSPQKIWYKNYLANFSSYVYAGANPSSATSVIQGTTPIATGFSTSYNVITTSAGLWNQNAQGVTFSAIGNKTYNLSGGVDYSASNGFTATLADLVTAYNLFSNKDQIGVDYLIQGPGLVNKSESQAKANQLISIAESRKDCIAVISPHRADVVDVANSDTQTTNVVSFFSPLSSSSYAVFDDGYKYTYDRFNNLFRYIPCNADIAGLMCRTNINSYPWFSPAGQQRGVLNNAIKLAYNASKAQRDVLYTARVNAIVNQPGIGIILFGDKTALGYASAFDRINVRRLFLTVEQAFERTANAQIFQFNDDITRANFINIVEPYLRDVQAKRGVYDFRVICDESNNTPDIIDNNEFRADIFLKPSRSINYVTLTFVATRTGISFEEAAGRV